MQTIHVQGTDLAYEEKDILKFDEGLIGMPQLRRMVLIHYSEIAPLMLLCSLDQADVMFLVLETKAHIPDYAPRFFQSDFARPAPAPPRTLRARCRTE